MEIEVKLQYKNKEKLIKILQNNGFKLTALNKIVDLYFGQGHVSMESSKKLCRLRNINDKFFELTLKDRSVDNKNILTRRELSIPLDSVKDIQIILTSLGCRLIKKHIAHKEIWSKGKTHFEFIRVVSPLKLVYAEIEANSEQQINYWLEKLTDFIRPVGEDIFAKFDKKRA
jgi:predicted adenylyl cyclase CyaB